MLNAVLLCMCCNGEFSSFAWKIESQKEKLKVGWSHDVHCYYYLFEKEKSVHCYCSITQDIHFFVEPDSVPKSAQIFICSRGIKKKACNLII